ncbi:MAG: phosphoribosylglycinamide formyltransferase [Arenicella sp.]
MSTPFNIVVLISGNGSNLQALIDGMQNQELPINITAVISNKADAYGLQRARDANIPALTLSHKDFDTRQDFDAKLAELVDEHSPDLIVLAGFMRIFSEGFVDQFADRIVNIHPSLLPKYTGLNTHQRALSANEKYHGVSIHFVTAELDAGPVIIQGRLTIKPDDTAETLQQRVHSIEHIIYPLAVKWFAQNRITLNNGQALLDGHASSEQLVDFDC